VTIEGYSGPQEDPVISPDGLSLFFDSHNDSGLMTYLYWAARIDYKTFHFMGEVQGTNRPGQATLRGNYDETHNFYFVSTSSLSPCGTIAHGVFSNGAVAGAQPLNGLCALPPPQGDINATFDVAITSDGATLYHTDAVLSPGSQAPRSAQIGIAMKNPDGSFTELSDSATLLATVNALGPLVYNSAPTPDGLALFFTMVNPFVTGPATYAAPRASTCEPFGPPQHVAEADAPPPGVDAGVGFSEVGGLSPDGQHLYMHWVLGASTSQIYVLTRQ
jgi:hypothetical protein